MNFDIHRTEVMIKGRSLLYSQEVCLIVIRKPYGTPRIEHGLVAYKASAPTLYYHSGLSS